MKELTTSPESVGAGQFLNISSEFCRKSLSFQNHPSSHIKLFCEFIDLVQVPTTWIPQTIETIKRLKKAIPDNCPEKMRLILAEEELFTISNNLNEFATKLVVRKEPIKTSLVVELKSSSTGERKLRTLFLFDDLLVSAHQRVIVFRKHFTEADGDKPADASEILLDSETMSTFSEKSDPVSLQMRTRSISRYEVKWFLPLDQLDSLRTDGLAFDDEALRERLICIENLKSKIKDVRAELEEERRNADKESKRQKFKAPKIHRLRSTLYGLQAELVLQAPRLPLFLNSTDGRTFCLLMTSERERMEWKKLITQAKQSKDPNKVLEKQPVSKKMSTLKSLTSQLPSFRQSPKPKDPVTRFTNSEVTSLVNHCKTVVPLNRLGKIIISGSALSGILQVTIHEVTGLDDIASYFIAVEVDCFGMLEPVAKTRPITGTCSPCWNQTFLIELESSQSASFTLYRQSTVIAQLELPLDLDQLVQYSETEHTVRTFESPPKTIKMKLSLSFTEQTRAFVQHPSMENSDIFGLSLAEVIRKDQLRSERLQKVASALRAEKITGMDDALAPSGVCVPIIVSTCAEEIERRGLTEEGIYRISGSLSSVNYLKDQFNRDVDTAVKQLADYDVNVLTSLLKAFFRGLPEPLIKSNEFVAFVNALEIADDGERIRMLNRTLASLPKPRRDTFQYLLCHLVRVSEHESSNKMSLSNLALIWAMTLFQPPTGVSEAERAFMMPNMTSIASMGAIQTRLLHELLKSTAEGTFSLDSTDF
uniref:Breakpoint cluster region protein n=1 Tax=Schistocephalus solidus TaxID=70667 RepID=A0A0X3PUR6_SCHSO